MTNVRAEGNQRLKIMIIYLDLKHTFPLNIFFIVIIKVLEN